MNFKRQQTIEHIELHLNKVRTAGDDIIKARYINKAVGILSLANLLDMITIEEYEHYFAELYK